MIGIVIPAHNEEQVIRICLAAVSRAAQHPSLTGEPVETVVVLDDCTDATCVEAGAAGAMTLSIRARNVGMARAAGAQAMLARGARWLAFTDADTVVSEAWLANQLELQADVVCGTVCIQDWSPHGANAELLESHFKETYFDRDDHRHVHGANLGVSAEAYRAVGGFRHLACGEDEALVAALVAAGRHVAWSSLPRVVTSARVHARAPGGFAGALLNAVAQRLAEAAAPLHTATAAM
ncbi:glycosyltransferase family 2 protein [Variovorax sp. J22G73]|uniref:glycosyltransferase n=1 Tax=unclassified Variovorax TaxID=663243 RepID=UPI002578E71A|nr:MULTISPECIES: glycosyltransferase family 2 protein [unclassified Variovorax]MDM0009473.1 glycosyltransferase family 2 protein [Variovorax sp. J22R203]MDM0101981.1 glycosyltransferase family 2 protein [Variovorax sp. J22G73]